MDKPQIEAKNLMILENQLNYEALAVKKYRQSAQRCTNEELITILHDAAAKHKAHFDSLLDYLNSHK